ncbi:hypothetical protein [Rothia mucilaginosa]|nr:hypothetical protein [Rothia mucilaginosa]
MTEIAKSLPNFRPAPSNPNETERPRTHTRIRGRLFRFFDEFSIAILI